jgi:uncharacterized protein YeaO (DUF488 family)
MPIKLKRWNDRRKKDDGYRLLVCRHRPRALPTEKETWDSWCPDLGPSVKLHADLYGKKAPAISWDDFRVRYLEEMQAQGEFLDELADLVSEGKTITLLCSSACTDEAKCHRSLLRDLIEERVGLLPGPAPVSAPVEEAAALS